MQVPIVNVCGKICGKIFYTAVHSTLKFFLWDYFLNEREGPVILEFPRGKVSTQEFVPRVSRVKTTLVDAQSSQTQSTFFGLQVVIRCFMIEIHKKISNDGFRYAVAACSWLLKL